MSKILVSESVEARAEIAALFEKAPPVLVEVRFPNAATSPDWFLCAEEEQVDKLLERLGPGAELHVSSVWDLKNVKKAICLKK